MWTVILGVFGFLMSRRWVGVGRVRELKVEEEGAGWEGVLYYSRGDRFVGSLGLGC